MEEQKIITDLLHYIGEDPNREGLLDTPKRVLKMYKEITTGYTADEEALFRAVFSTDNQSMVVVKDIDYFSLCEHHMIPFFGKVHIGYIPNGKVLGLSKFARLVEVYARRLQIQEQLTHQIAESIVKHLDPLGVIIVIEGTHLCMSMRGIQKINANTTTSAIRGKFFEDSVVRNEFLSLLNK